MVMTREMDYALRIVRALYQNGQLSAASIAQREQVPKAITLKILKQLHTAGLVDSRRGPSGGYLLQRDCETLYLWDVVHALGESLYVNRCQQPGYQCENRSADNCALSLELSRVQQVLDEELQRTPLSQLFQEEPD